IAPLCERFLGEACRVLDRAQPLRLSPEALGYLTRYAWPGNVRELRNVIERAAVLSSGDVIVPADLPAQVTGAPRGPTGASGPGAEAVGAADGAAAPAVADERQRIVDALEQCAGNQTHAAKLLGISLRTLVKRLGEYDVPRPRKRS